MKVKVLKELLNRIDDDAEIGIMRIDDDGFRIADDIDEQIYTKDTAPKSIDIGLCDDFYYYLY